MLTPGTVLSIYRGHSERVAALSWSPDGRYITSGSWDKTVHIWDARMGSTLLTYSNHSGRVETVA